MTSILQSDWDATILSGQLVDARVTRPFPSPPPPHKRKVKGRQRQTTSISDGMAVIRGHLGWPLSGGWSLLGASANGGSTVH